MDSIIDEFEEQCRQGIFPPITRWLERIDEDKKSQLFVELLTIELHYRRLQGTPQGKEYCIVQYPEYADQVQQAIAADNMDLVATQNYAVHNPKALENSATRIGRFAIQKRLGQGGFGLVYLALDEQLDRLVALKIPRPDLHLDSESAETYVKEAKTLARLDHPHIVPILEVGSTPEHPIYIVSKYIDGSDLGKWMSQAPRSQEQLVQVMFQLADGLKAAHKHGIVHRDIKPQNVLVDRNERIYLVDFGLALRDQDIGKKLPTGGTPGYMSPEQVKGEGHRVDGRSDLFSVGVVFYEMLTGRRPFAGSTQLELFEQIKELDPKPPRQWNESIDRELERVCLKLLAKRKSDRYSSAQDLIEDLDAFLKRNAPTQSQSSHIAPTVRQTPIANETENDKEKETPVAVTPGSGSSVLKIVPKGLRSFDQQDADFFLELLPGPRDRNGLPDTIAFWRSRIEERDADKTFNVGLVYGPSGCGKSSMMKAGLIPRLTKNIVAIYLEATTDQTEGTLLYQLRKRLDSEHISYPESTNLLDLLTVIRRGKVLPSNKKLLIVIDQFEQWLYAHTVANGTELLDALLQCDGSRLQAIVMVRDDFWMAATRFFRDLDIRLVEGHNSAAVDLFDIDHATRVLKAFGRAFGKLDVDGAEDKQDRKQFVTDAVQGLAEDNKVISVRLSLFAEMMKGRQWTPESLHEVGGTAGVGATFLEETFSASGAPPEHRYHQQAARAVLRSLLPDGGTEIKGHRRSREELLEASGYSGRTRDFQDLIRILDNELRLITPVDSTETQALAATNEPFEVTETRLAPAAQVDYQLTHDYLVPSLRDWLTRKQRETKKGRAELKLAERASAWNAARENKQLPTFWEWLSIRTLTDGKSWTAAQRNMLTRANRHHLSRLAMVATIIGLITAGGWYTWNRVDRYQKELVAQKAKEQEATRIEGLVGRLVSADPNQISAIVKDLDTKAEISDVFLSPFLTANATTLDEKRRQLHARLASVGRDPSLVEPLLEELLGGKVAYAIPIREQLRPYANQLKEKLGTILRDEKAENNRRFRAALALSYYVPETETTFWTDDDLKLVTEQLMSTNSEFQPLLREALRPIRSLLYRDMETIFNDTKASDAQRLGAANSFADYASDNIAKLSQLLTVATPEQHSVLYPIVAAAPATSTLEALSKTASTLPPDNLGSVDRVAFGKRRANAAVTMLRLGEREKVLSVFDMTDDPEALTQFIFRCRSRGVRVEEVLDVLTIATRSVSEGHAKLTSEPAAGSSLADASGYDWSRARYALLLTLGEYSLNEVPESQRDSLLAQLADWYRNEPSGAIHGASGWLLRKWGQEVIAQEVDQTPVPYSPEREWFTLAIKVMPTPQPITFYYTFIVFPTGEYDIGSVGDEPEGQKDEVRHRVKLNRSFAILDREVTMAELIACDPSYNIRLNAIDRNPEDAGYAAHWYESVEFCRWLSRQWGVPESEQSYADPETLDPEQYPLDKNPVADRFPRNWPLEFERRGFRLPTESEWEVASRSGMRTAYGFGGDERMLDRFGWLRGNSEKHVHPPREQRPNLRGLFDLHGNVNEWTHDWYGDYDTELQNDPLGQKLGTLRVNRGGNWNNDAAYCRAANRGKLDPVDRAINLGFRLALSPSAVSNLAEHGEGAEAKASTGGTEGASAELP